MSVNVMSTVFNADLTDLDYEKDGVKHKAKASTVKLMLLAYADHANDEGNASYPGYTRLERKTALSRQGIADTLEALTQNEFMILVGTSDRGTNSYRINVKKLESLVKPLDHKKKRVKPLDRQESSHLTTGSQATRLNPSLSIPNHPISAEADVSPSQEQNSFIPDVLPIQESSLPLPSTPPVIQAEPPPLPPAAPLPWPAPKPAPPLSSLAKDKPARQPPAKKKGDLLDAMLEAAAKANDPQVILAGKIQQFPEDVQDTLTELIRLYRWPAGAIPDKPRNGKGGKYAQWINEIRDIDKIIAGFGVDALEMSVRACRDITVSHPGAMTWCLAGEVGKLADRQEKDTFQQEPDEPLTFTPPPEEMRRAAYERMQGYSNA